MPQVIKLVNATSLDSGLTDIADAIRDKGGTSAGLTFPDGFVDAVEAIETGSTGYSLIGIANGTEPSGEIDISGTYALKDYAFTNCVRITKVTGTVIGNQNKGYWFQGCTGILTANVHIAGTTGSGNGFGGCSNMTTIVLKIDGTNNMTGINHSCSRLAVADYNISRLRVNNFYNNSQLTTIILRQNNIVSLENLGGLTTGTPFRSGGAGGTIYIPKALYDHLGDGTSLDYKAASNWSTVDGYGTITWAQIEGSIYETQYADGTPIT